MCSPFPDEVQPFMFGIHTEKLGVFQLDNAPPINCQDATIGLQEHVVEF